MGNSINGSNATTGMGSASVIHQHIMSVAIANTLHGSGSKPTGLIFSIKNNKMMPNAIFNLSNCFLVAG
jgi:hypothetical protein